MPRMIQGSYCDDEGCPIDHLWDEVERAIQEDRIGEMPAPLPQQPIPQTPEETDQ